MAGKGRNFGDGWAKYVECKLCGTSSPQWHVDKDSNWKKDRPAMFLGHWNEHHGTGTGEGAPAEEKDSIACPVPGCPHVKKKRLCVNQSCDHLRFYQDSGHVTHLAVLKLNAKIGARYEVCRVQGVRQLYSTRGWRRQLAQTDEGGFICKALGRRSLW